MNHSTYGIKSMSKPKYPELKWVVCIEYLAQSGAKVISRSAPKTYKEAHKRRRECVALKKGLRCWVEKKAFELK